MKQLSKQKKNPKRTYILLGAGVLALAGFGYWYFKGRKAGTVDEADADLFQTMSTDLPKATTKTRSSGFPLKSGSRGELVKQVQVALMKTYGTSILPKYGVDSQFGTELVQALKSKGFPQVIDQPTFQKITGTNPVVAKTPLEAGKQSIDIATKLWQFSTTQNLPALIAQLKRITSVNQYQSINTYFKTIRLNGVRQTIVNGTLNSFSDESSKQLIRQELIRIGLKYNGSQWALAGIPNQKVMTSCHCTICNREGISIEVPPWTFLGMEISQRQGMTAFRTIDRQILYVPTQHIHHV